MSKIHKTRTGIGVISFVVLMLFGIVAYRKIGLEEQSDMLNLKKVKLEAQINEQEDRATSIKNLEAYVQTKRYIEDVAREKLGLVYEDEIIFRREENEE